MKAKRLIFLRLFSFHKTAEGGNMLKRKPKVLTPEQMEEIRTKDFFDMILSGTIKFLSDHYILGDSYRCTWVIREYPPSTDVV